jgi:hypothetical protein
MVSPSFARRRALGGLCFVQPARQQHEKLRELLAIEVMTTGDSLDARVLQRRAEAPSFVADEAGVALKVLHDRTVLTQQHVLVAAEDDEGGNGTPSGQVHDVECPEHVMTCERVLEVPLRGGVIVSLLERREVSRTLLSCVLGTIAALPTPDLEQRESLDKRSMLDSTCQADNCSPRVAHEETDAGDVGTDGSDRLDQVVDVHAHRRIRDRRVVDRTVAVPAQVDRDRMPTTVCKPSAELVPLGRRTGAAVRQERDPAGPVTPRSMSEDHPPPPLLLRAAL